jgi:hypothetical protein
MMAWFKWSGATTTNPMVFYNGNSSSNGYGCYLDSTSSYKLRCLAGGISWIDLPVTFVPTANTWYHLILIRRSAPWEIYIDGVTKNIVSSANPNLPSGNFRIGNAEGIPLNGLVDSVRFYNRALSVAEISAIYNAEK